MSSKRSDNNVKRNNNNNSNSNNIDTDRKGGKMSRNTGNGKSTKSNANHRNRSNNNKTDYSGNRNYQDKFAKSERMKGYKEGVYSVETNKTDNDPSWYVPNAQMVKDVASIPFNDWLGNPIIPNHNQTKSGDAGKQFIAYNIGVNVPGICTLEIAPYFNTSDGALSPINLAMADVYTQMQIKSGRTPSYEGPDVMKVIIALSNAYGYYQFLTRLYGVIKNFSVLDKYTPKALINANHCDYENLSANLADFRIYINQFAYQLQSFPLPQNFDYAARQIFMYQNVYTDGNSQKHQYYMYVPSGFMIYSEGLTTQPLSQLTYTPLLKNNYSDVTSVEHMNMLKLIDLIDYGNAMLTPLRSSEDVRMISADIINTFNSYYQVNPIAETYSISPVYNAEVLSQMENAYIQPKGFYALTLSENTNINAGYLTAVCNLNPAYYNAGYPAALSDVSDLLRYGLYYYDFTDGKVLLNFHSDTVTPEQVLVASRFSSNQALNYIDDGEEGIRFFPNCAGTEVVLNCCVYMYNLNVDNTSTYMLSRYLLRTNNVCTRTAQGITATTPAPLSTINTVETMLTAMNYITSFDWHPYMNLLIIQRNDDAEASLSVLPGLFEWQNFTSYNVDLQNKMNKVAVEGLFTVK